ncbi:Fascin-like incomplete domain containing protein [Pandoravirus macleodensis]|uniref:Fascin-like incomplete domain containing protein n=1 Tax=Pandoravirus macleodensis TaxID=2107707 RepID=A0A2U7UG05_9VIRU|nr:Fascin-like incomplete domain containing protein [Pandoravirus macleodensis]AVK77396.1 Fascin-like incomplete domain containing protein [Pandoravirus macleodensis]
MQPTGIHAATALSVIAFVLFCQSPVAIDAYHYSVFVQESRTWAPPANATNIVVTLWGAGGGSSTTLYCGAGGGGGATILGRAVDPTGWPVSVDGASWMLTVGKGGLPPPAGSLQAVAGNGGATSVAVVAPGGAVLFNATAYGGGGGSSSSAVSRDGCQGGAGGGEASSAVGTVPGTGNPSGGADDDRLAAPKEGAMVGDVKAGSAGAGYGYVGGNIDQPFTTGAQWYVSGRLWYGGEGRKIAPCRSWGGGAAYNGRGGFGSNNAGGPGLFPRLPPANSGSGAGSAESCVLYEMDKDVPGADGAIIIEYDHPIAPTPSTSPTPSRTPSPSATRSPTPSTSPSPTAQPLTQLITLVSPISGKQLTPQDDGSVKSLWYGASYKEKWTVARLSNGKYTFKSFANRYLGADPGGWARADATSVGSWEQWDVIINAGNQWTLKSVHGTYMGTTVAGVVYLNGDSTLYWTKTNV